MNYSQLAFQGYLEKTGLSISESEYIARNARISFSSYLEKVAEMMPVAGKKNAKAEASRIILLSNLIAQIKMMPLKYTLDHIIDINLEKKF